MGCFLGFGDTFEILECIRVADIVEPFFVFGINTSVFVAKTNIASWTITMCKVLLLDSQKHTIILYYYSMILSHDGGVVYILE